MGVLTLPREGNISCMATEKSSLEADIKSKMVFK